MSKKKQTDSQENQPKTSEPQDQPVAQTEQDEFTNLRQERDDLMGRLQRVSADYLNYQKRVLRDIEEARTFANTDLIKDLLGILDDMERALEAARVNHGEDDPLFKGMQLVHDKALTTLGKFGLEVIDAKDKPFDPELHSAMARMPSAETEPNTVLEELIKGYTLKGRTIRPTSVVVATEPDPSTE